MVRYEFNKRGEYGGYDWLGRGARWTALSVVAFAGIAGGLRFFSLKNLESKVSQSIVVNERVEDFNSCDKCKSAEFKSFSYSVADYKDIQNVLYGEAANQSKLGRELVARTILNRVRNSDYPNDVHGVVYDRNAFSCTFDNVNKNWKQAVGALPRNGYEEMVYEKCGGDAREILDGKKLGIPRENEIIAYHDDSIGKPKGKYWDKLEPVVKVGRLIFYVPKKN